MQLNAPRPRTVCRTRVATGPSSQGTWILHPSSRRKTSVSLVCISERGRKLYRHETDRPPRYSRYASYLVTCFSHEILFVEILARTAFRSFPSAPAVQRFFSAFPLARLHGSAMLRNHADYYFISPRIAAAWPLYFNRITRFSPRIERVSCVTLDLHFFVSFYLEPSTTREDDIESIRRRSVSTQLRRSISHNFLPLSYYRSGKSLSMASCNRQEIPRVYSTPGPQGMQGSKFDSRKERGRTNCTFPFLGSPAPSAANPRRKRRKNGIQKSDSRERLTLSPISTSSRDRCYKKVSDPRKFQDHGEATEVERNSERGKSLSSSRSLSVVDRKSLLAFSILVSWCQPAHYTQQRTIDNQFRCLADKRARRWSGETRKKMDVHRSSRTMQLVKFSPRSSLRENELLRGSNREQRVFRLIA